MGGHGSSATRPHSTRGAPHDSRRAAGAIPYWHQDALSLDTKISVTLGSSCNWMVSQSQK